MSKYPNITFVIYGILISDYILKTKIFLMRYFLAVKHFYKRLLLVSFINSLIYCTFTRFKKEDQDKITKVIWAHHFYFINLWYFFSMEYYLIDFSELTVKLFWRIAYSFLMKVTTSTLYFNIINIFCCYSDV